jgi:hypothetical protein
LKLTDPATHGRPDRAATPDDPVHSGKVVLAHQRRCTDPAGPRDGDHDAVRAVVLHLDVRAVALDLPDAKGLVHVVADLNA